jgi:hypothetical protein
MCAGGGMWNNCSGQMMARGQVLQSRGTIFFAAKSSGISRHGARLERPFFGIANSSLPSTPIAD